MTFTPSVLVLGARGRFGLAAARAFARAGWRVTAQCRPGGAPLPEPLPGAPLRWLRADAGDVAALRAGAGRVDVVVHAMNPVYTDAAWRAQAPGLMAAAIAASRAFDALLMFPGNVYNFGAGMPERLREDTPQRPTTAKGAMRVALEQQLAQAFASQGLRSVVIRAGDFFGGGGDTLLDLVAKDLPRGRMRWLGRPGVPTPWAYLPDLAEAFVQVAARRAAIDGHEVLHFAGHRLALEDWRAVLAGIARDRGWVRAGGELKVDAMPWGLLRLGGLVLPTWASIAQMRYLWRTPHALDNARLLGRIGQEPRTPLETAVLQALDLSPAGQLGAPPRPVAVARGAASAAGPSLTGG